MPAEVGALVLRAEAGAELTCKAREKEFDDGGGAVPRGVVSYYAARLMAGAESLHAWLQLVEDASQVDAAAGKLTPLYQPHLQVIGDGDLPLIGRFVGAAVVPDGWGIPP